MIEELRREIDEIRARLAFVESGSQSSSSAAAGSSVIVKDEGSTIVTATSLNFVGSGVVATDGGSGVATVTIAGGSAPVSSVFGRTGAVLAVAGDYTAAKVSYDNTGSGLSATTVQAAIDEVAASVPSSDPFFSPPLAASFATSLTNGVGPITENEFADVANQGLAFQGTLRNSTPESILRVKAAPSAPWTITTRFTFQYPAKKIMLCGLAFRDSADNEMEWFGILTDSTTVAPQLRIYRVTGTTVNTVPLTTNAALLFGHIYLRASLDVSGNLTYSTSSDGRNFEVALTTTLATFIDAIDQVGFFMAKFSGGGSDDRYSMMISYYNEA